MKKRHLPVLLVPFCVLPLQANPVTGSVEEHIAAQFDGITAAQVRPAPVPGFFEVRFGGEILYVSADGTYLLQGDLFEVATGRNLSDERRASARSEAVGDVGEASMVIFAPEAYQHTITVFTDIDCGYCRRLHRELAQYLRNGIRVRYLAFPRTGPGTDSWRKAEEVWCAPDRGDALTRAKLGERLGTARCADSPVAAHYELGRQLGIRGTPALISDTGELIGGYLPAPELRRQLDQGRSPL